MALKTGRTGDAEFPAFIKSFVMGLPKSGKTTFGSTYPNVVFLDLEFDEQGLQSVAHKNVPYIKIETRQDLQSATMILSDDTLRQKLAGQLNMPKIESVAIDTIDRYQQLLKAARLSENSNAFKGRNSHDDWSWLLECMRTDVGKIVSLPMHVALLCHSKQVQIEESLTVEAPLLQGQFADDVPGMVGYSLAALKRRKLDEQGNSFTEYVLQTEGDEYQPFLGNRAAGRLEKFIEQDFQVLHQAVYANLQLGKSQQAMVDTDDAPSQPSVQPPDQPEQRSVEDAQPERGAPKDDADQPIHAAALEHLSKVYDEFGLPLPTDADKWSLGKGRKVMGAIINLKGDIEAGKVEAVEDQSMENAVRERLVSTLKELEAFTDPADPEVAERLPLGKNVDEWIEWVEEVEGDARSDRARRALEHEEANKNRKTLVGPLRGILGEPDEDEEGEPETEQEVPEPEPQPEVESPESDVTSEGQASETATVEQAVSDDDTEEKALEEEAPESSEVITKEEAVANVKEQLGGEELSGEERWESLPETQRPCVHGGYFEGCNKSDATHGESADPPGDEFDLDIARLSVNRFNKWYCIDHYIGATSNKQSATQSV